MKVSGTILLLIFLCSLVGACATEALIKDATSDITSTKTDPGSIKLIKAFRQGDMAYLCLKQQKKSMLGIPRQLDEYVVSIPLPNSHKLHLSYSNDKKYPTYRTSNHDVKEQACNTIGTPIAVVALKNTERMELPRGNKEAIYVFYSNNSLRALGYVSTQAIPINQAISGSNMKEVYNYSITLDDTDLYEKLYSAKPLLLLLSPITVAIDTISTFLIVLSTSVSGSGQ